MLFMSRSTSRSRRTRKTERKARFKFNHSLRPKADQATRLAARTALVAEAEKGIEAAHQAMDAKQAELKIAESGVEAAHARITAAKEALAKIQDQAPEAKSVEAEAKADKELENAMNELAQANAQVKTLTQATKELPGAITDAMTKRNRVVLRVSAKNEFEAKRLATRKALAHA